jgi:hypothetical protein
MKWERFSAVLLEGHKVFACEVPFNPETQWGVKAVNIRRGRNGVRVKGMLNKTMFESAVVARARKFWVEIDDETMRAARVSGADEVKVALIPIIVTDDDPLAKVREICLALPEATEKIAWGSPTFRVRNKIFVMYGNNHHGDGRVAIWCNATLDAQELLVANDPEHFFVPAYVGGKGWIGIRLDRGLSWKVIASLVKDGYRLTAPKQLRHSV